MKPGDRVGTYEITALIGAGGMGEVWRARDARLGREVAVKVLPPEVLADETARRRLVHEARVASKLNHPNVCTIYEVGETDGQTYIAMELVEGKPLSDLVRSGALPVAQVVRYAQQLSDALAHAHQRGIVHRDLKSGNVVITPDGRVKVLDFGLAKRLGGEEGVSATSTTISQDSLTAPGTVVGTLAYMSPEQLRGRPADERSDIWSFGVVLYEMATGLRPFRGATGFELSSAILDRAAPELPLTVPVALAAVIERCLAKEPDQRYQRSGEVRAALEAVASGTVPPLRVVLRSLLTRHGWQVMLACLVAAAALLVWLNVGGVRARLLPGTVTPRIESLAVLPLANVSGDPEEQYFADGMTEALIARFGTITALRVISRTSVMRFRQTTKPLGEIAKELGVDAVVEGTVQKSKDRVRVTASLLLARSDRQLWSETYDADLGDVFALQDDVARAIADRISITVTEQERRSLSRQRPVNAEAYELYLRGCYHYHKWQPEEFKKAIGYFEEATQVDPNLAVAYVGLANSYGWLWIAGLLPLDEGLPQYRAALGRALQIDDMLPEAHYALAASAYFYSWDWAEAEKEFKRALELNPSLEEARFEYAWFLSSMGRHAEAVVEARRAVRLDPLSVPANLALGSVYYLARLDDQALVQWRQTIELEPYDPRAYGFLAGAYEQLGRFDEAVQARQKVMSLAGVPTDRIEAIGRIYSESGKEGYLGWRLEQQKDPYDRGAICARLGRIDQALDCLERAYQEHSWQMLRLKVDRDWEPLQSQPRYQDLLRRMNFPP